jgi:subtilisin family serine protease
MRRRFSPLLVAFLLAACSPSSPKVAPVPAPAHSPATAPGPTTVPLAEPEPEPVLPPKDAFLRGWMPLKPTGVDEFLKAHPTSDGRGVLIGILDSGIDPGVPGLVTTSTGERKVLDVRDFSGEGAVTLTPVTMRGDQITVAGHTLTGASRLRTVSAGGSVYAGVIAEISLGDMPAADLNGDHDDTDTLAVVVVRASDGWVLFADTDGDGSLANETPVHDYLVARETFAWHTGKRPPSITIAVNFKEEKGEPRLDLYFDTSGHGTHVAGIAAGNDMYNVTGFDGVAPGAYLLGLKIADDAQGGISTSGSMLAAMSYAIRFAHEHRLPLVLNLSFGVGNETEGKARIDLLVDSVLKANPDVVFTISAGNDGPGLSTIGYPGSSSRAITIGATFPGVFLGASGRGGDPIAYFSSRGGELAKPDIVAPGLAYSTVPRWNTGDERKGGTSMASPHAAGLAALLVSGLTAEKQPVEARQVRQALMVTARPLAGGNYLDDGTGQPDVAAAWRWLAAVRSVPDITVRAIGHGQTASFQKRRLGDSADTSQSFEVSLPAGASEAEVTLRSSALWLRTPTHFRLRSGANTINLGYHLPAIGRPGVYTGVVTGWTGDTLAGPAFRLVNTVVVADTGPNILARLNGIPAGGNGRLFFEAFPSRPFAVTFATRSAGEQILAFLHEPGGQPFREENGIGAGFGEQAGSYVIDGRDVVRGFYEAVAVAPPLDGVSATIGVEQSPVTIDATRGRDGIVVQLTDLGSNRVTSEPFVMLVGAERTAKVVARGSEVQRIRFQLPDWAVHAVVDVQMDRDQWPIFTDCGVTLFGDDGRQIAKSPLNYAFGRLHADLPKPSGAPGPRSAEVALFPGFADSGGDPRWTATVSIRLYADSAHVTKLASRSATVEPGSSALVTLPMTDPPLKLGDGFVPLGIVVVPVGERTWTREASLGPAVTPLSQ